MNETWEVRRQMTPYEGNEDYIFISYSHQDMDLVLPVLWHLQENGVRFWYDEGIDPGSEWPESIAMHLNGCRGCLAFISPHSLDSPNCRREVNYALSKNKDFLSVMLSPVEMSMGMEMQISSYQSLLKYKYVNEVEFLNKLLSVEMIANCRSENGWAPNASAGTRASAGQATWVRTKTSTAAADKPKKQGKVKTILIAAAAVLAGLFLIGTLAGSPEEPPDRDLPSQSVEPTPEQGANAQLLAVIDRAQEAHKNATDALPDLSGYTNEDGSSDLVGYVGSVRQWVQILEDFLADLAELREEADAVSGLDDKLKNAKDEYFAMLHDVRAAHIETYTFIADYFDFYMETVAWRPLEVDYYYVDEYADALSAWVQEARKGYAAISCPTSMQSVWAQYGDALEYNASIAQKVNTAVQCRDMLRRSSAQYMTQRYLTVEEKLYGKLLDCMNGENRHANRQWGILNSLAEEMHTYAELDQGEREAYEFTYNRSGKIYLDYEAVDTIFPSLYNTYNAFVIFKTGCVSGTRTVVVEAEIPGFTQKYQQLYRLDSAYTEIYIKPPALTGELDLSSAKSAQISITVSDQDGTLIDSKSFPVTIKSKTDFKWYSSEYGNSTQDNILCFLTPESSAVRELKRQAIDEIIAISDGAIESFPGYQSATSVNYATTYLQAAGLMSALYKMGVRYDMSPFSISGSDQQRIKLPEDVIAERSGLCIETSLAVASALQSAGMHAFLIFPPGHAQVAVELWNSGDWRGVYYLIETTALDMGSNNIEIFAENFQRALEGLRPNGDSPITYLADDELLEYLENKVEYVIDCDDSQLLGLTPFAN